MVKKSSAKTAVSDDMPDIKAQITFDDKNKIVSFTTIEDKVISIKCPKAKQMFSLRKLIKSKKIDNDDDQIAIAFGVFSVIKYGEKNSMSMDDFDNLDMVDSIIMLECLEFFRPAISRLQSFIQSKNR